MEEWTEIRFAELPDPGTRREILDWVERTVSGRYLHFNTTDFLGRRSYGFRFQEPTDAQVFRHRWLAGTRSITATACGA